MGHFALPTKKKKIDKDEDFITFEIPIDPLKSICGQENAKKALEISLAGEFPICFYGPSGQGKSHLAQVYRDLYMKLYRRKVKYAVTDIEYVNHDTDAVIYAKLDRLPYSAIHKGFIGESSNDVLKRINNQLPTKELFITPTFWDILGQVYSRDKLTPKVFFNALKVARTIANLEQSEIVTKTHFKDALGFVTSPYLSLTIAKEAKPIITD